LNLVGTGDPLDSVHIKQAVAKPKQKAQVVKVGGFLGTATTLFRKYCDPGVNRCKNVSKVDESLYKGSLCGGFTVYATLLASLPSLQDTRT
jgi:hypothetical protein